MASASAPAPSSAGIWSAGTPLPTSSPARRLRLPSATATVATRSPAPARPAKVSLRPPRRAPARAPRRRRARRRRRRGLRRAAARGRGGERGGVLGAGGELGARHVVRGLDAGGRPSASASAELAARRRGREWPGPPRRRASTASRRAPARRGRRPRGRARARPRRRSGVVPSGATRPLEATSTALRSPMCAPTLPTAAGRLWHGTANTTRSTPANSMSATVQHVDAVVERRRPAGSARSRRRRRALGLRRPCGSRAGPRDPRARASSARAVPIEPAPTTAALRSGGRPPSHSHCSSRRARCAR